MPVVALLSNRYVHALAVSLAAAVPVFFNASGIHEPAILQIVLPILAGGTLASVVGKL